MHRLATRPSRRLCAAASGVAALLLAAAAEAFQPHPWAGGPPGVPGPEYDVVGVPPRDAGQPWTQWERLSGNWSGWRDRVQDAGVQILGDYITEIAGNATGGLDRSITYTHNVGVWLNVDLDTVLGWRGGQLHVSASNRVGTSLSQKHVGNTFAVQQIFGGETTRLVDLALEQSLAGGAVDLRAGRLDWGDEFAHSPYYCQFQNVGFCGNPVSIPINVNLPTYPNTLWGAYARLQPVDWGYLKLGVYNTVKNFRANEFHGVDFTIRDDSGVAFAWEAAYLRNAQDSDPGLRGLYKVGGYVDSEPLVRFSSGNLRSGANGVYVAVDQELYLEPHQDKRQGLDSFIALAYAGPELAKVQYYAIAGLLYRGLVPDRAADVTGLGLIAGGFSSDLRASQRAQGKPGQTQEIVLEANYEIVVFPWLQVQPDVQYVLNPGGTGTIGDALVFALQVNIPI